MSKILLVEDDDNLREIYEARLKAEGYDIVDANDGEEALVIAKKERPDLIVADVMMPRVSGFEMLDILRNTPELRDVKVVMLTALGQAEDKTRADQLGADRYLVKSQVTLEDIVKAASDLLGGGGSGGTDTNIISPTSPAGPAGPPVAPPPQTDSEPQQDNQNTTSPPPEQNNPAPAQPPDQQTPQGQMAAQPSQPEPQQPSSQDEPQQAQPSPSPPPMIPTQPQTDTDTGAATQPEQTTNQNTSPQPSPEPQSQSQPEPEPQTETESSQPAETDSNAQNQPASEPQPEPATAMQQNADDNSSNDSNAQQSQDEQPAKDNTAQLSDAVKNLIIGTKTDDSNKQPPPEPSEPKPEQPPQKQATQESQPEPDQAAPEKKAESDSVTISGKKTISPLGADQAPKRADLNDLLAKENGGAPQPQQQQAGSTAPTVTPPHNLPTTPHPAGHVFSPNSSQQSASPPSSPTDPNSIAL